MADSDKGSMREAELEAEAARREAESPVYASDAIMFRPLTEAEVEEFRAYARVNDPPGAKDWAIYHPVCRRVWAVRGFRPGHP